MPVEWVYDPANMAAEATETEEERVAQTQSSLVVVAPGKSKMHLRRARKMPFDAPSYEVCWLVAQLNGVNVFVHEEDGVTTVMVTDKDLKP